LGEKKSHRLLVQQPLRFSAAPLMQSKPKRRKYPNGSNKNGQPLSAWAKNFFCRQALSL
jgi:hypothetical protein